MQVLIENVANAEDEKIILQCVRMTRDLEDIMDFALAKGNFITGYIDETAYRLKITDIIYFEAVGDQVFAYTEEEFYSVKKRLYEIETDYESRMFMRCSRSMVVNICQISSFRPARDAKFIAKMKNGEDIIVSRMYAKEIKKRIMEL